MAFKLFHFLKGLHKRESAGTTTPPRNGGMMYMSAFSVSPLSVATVFRCVNLISDSVANLPMRYLRLKDGVFREFSGNRLNYIFNVQPSPGMSAFDFWKTVVSYILIHGNAYVIPVTGPDLDYSYMMLPNPLLVSYDPASGVYVVNDSIAGIAGTFLEEDILHFKNYSTDGFTGLSTLGFARRATDIAGAGDTETLSRFVNGGSVRGIVSNGVDSVRGFGEYQDIQLEETAKSLDERFKTGERIVSIPGQASFSPLSLSSADMQFLETRKFSVRDICRFFGVHPSFVFDDTSNNYKSAENANAAFLTGTLNPILRRIENELLRKLEPESMFCKRRFEFDRRSLLACDLSSKVQYQTATIAAGIYTVNDWRRHENQPTVFGGDVPLVSANLKTITEAQAANAAPGENNNDNGK